MTIQIEFWQLLSSIAGIVTAFAVVAWTFGAVLLRQNKAHLSERLNVIHDELAHHATEEMKFIKQLREDDMETARQLRQFERDFAKFQIEMPLQYVRREDYIRGQTVIEAKLDALYSKLETVQLQGAKHD